MRVSDFDYELPADRIAQTPCKPRDHAKLLVMNRRSGAWSHHRFDALSSLLRPSDVLVLNNSKVFKARLLGRKETGGKIEIFLLRRIAVGQWEVLVGGHGAREGRVIRFGHGLMATLLPSNGDEWRIQFHATDAELERYIAHAGHVPLPPYIKTHARLSDYQTVFAKHSGSVAAPTAGLHFTNRLLEKLRARGMTTEFVTLHVGLGTFQPVKTTRVEDHDIHKEWASVSPATARRLNAAKRAGRRIIAVGTTSVRTLEGFSDESNVLHSGTRDLKLFIYPGYDFRFVDAMVTNFHLPKSSLLMLVSAFSTREHLFHAYNEAIRQHYRFYSFGDAMLIQ